MQRLTILLGHPSYGLSVVLFTLLLSSGIGSFVTGYYPKHLTQNANAISLGAVILTLTVIGITTPHVIDICRSSSLIVRTLVAIALMFPAGLLMGMPFPLGMKMACARVPVITPWLWAANGAMSVFGSILAIVLAVYAGISVAYNVGIAAYVCAITATIWLIFDSKTSITTGES